MKDTKLRNQLAYCLKYLRYGEYGYWVERENIEEHEDTLDTTYSDVNIADILDRVDPKLYSKIFIRGSSYEDYDNHDGSQVELYSYRKQTDQEYFDSLCSYILPTEYQQSQYETYLRLKKQFED